MVREPRLCLLLVVFGSAACESGLGGQPACDGPGDHRDGGPADAAATDDAASADSGGPDAAAPPPDASVDPADAGPDGYHLEDTLRGGATGNVLGGSLGADGWTVTAPTDRVWWALPTLVSGSVEVTVTGLTHEIFNPSDNEILTMYEGGYGSAEPIGYDPQYRSNFYKMMVRIYGPADDDRIGLQKLMWGMCPSGAPGFGECGCASFFEEPFGGDPAWDGTPQRIRIEWGNGRARLIRNGAEVVAVDWSATGLSFGPSELHFSLGSPRAAAVGDTGMPIGATFSDVVIDGVVGDPATCP